MNKRVLTLTILICLGIVIACALAGVTYYSRITNPAILTQEASEIEAANVATSTSQAYSQLLTATELARPTITPSPTSTVTPTSAPQATICEAQVSVESTNMYSVPGQGNRSSSVNLPIGETLKILGRLEDDEWLKVERQNGQQGWVKSSALKILALCRPTIFNLHYLASWLSSSENLILDDTFSVNANQWVDAQTKEDILIKNTVLKIDATTEKIVTTTTPRILNLPVFRLYTSFTTDKVIKDLSYVGFRFRDTGAEYLEIRFFSSNCKVELYSSGNLSYTNSVDARACVDRYYDLALSMSADYKLILDINGFDPLVINIQDPNNQYTQGTLGLVVNKINATFDYIVITAPK